MSAAVKVAQRCSAIRSDGQPCQAPVIRDGLCIGHLKGAQEARSKGGSATSNAERAARALPNTMRQVANVLIGTLGKVARGEYSPAQGQAIASIASALVRVYQVGEYEDHMRTLERWAHDDRLWRDSKGNDRGPIQWPTYTDDLTD
jgi:hypothetical protein